MLLVIAMDMLTLSPFLLGYTDRWLSKQSCTLSAWTRLLQTFLRCTLQLLMLCTLTGGRASDTALNPPGQAKILAPLDHFAHRVSLYIAL